MVTIGLSRTVSEINGDVRRKSNENRQLGLAVLIQYQSVTASHPASHVAVAIRLYAKASSVKMKLGLLQLRQTSFVYNTDVDILCDILQFNIINVIFVKDSSLISFIS